MIFAINYGGRAEIVQSMKMIFDELQENGLNSNDINETMIDQHLMTQNYPDPELLIRTSGEQRISNFLFGKFHTVNSFLMKNYGQTLMVKN